MVINKPLMNVCNFNQRKWATINRGGKFGYGASRTLNNWDVLGVKRMTLAQIIIPDLRGPCSYLLVGLFLTPPISSCVPRIAILARPLDSYLLENGNGNGNNRAIYGHGKLHLTVVILWSEAGTSIGHDPPASREILRLDFNTLQLVN